MILKTLYIDATEFEQRTGWAIKPEGACKDELCVPLPSGSDPSRLDAHVLAERLNMPLLHDETHNVWCLGPQGGGRVLNSVVLPDIVLPDLNGNPFALRSLQGQKTLLVAWASW